MLNHHQPNPYPYYICNPIYYPYDMYNGYSNYPYPYPYWDNIPMNYPDYNRQLINLKDYGPNPFVINIEKATKQNNNFRIALWTGNHLQLTLMSINMGDDIGLEVHPNLDQFIRIESGQGLVQMGDRKDKLDFQRRVYDDYAIVIPAGKWHNLINTGNKPLKLYSIYAPPEHPHSTIHKTKQDAEEDHEY